MGGFSPNRLRVGDGLNTGGIMRSEKEIRERLESLRDMEKREWEVFREIDELEWVLDGQSEAVAKPLLGDGWRDARKEIPKYKFIMLVFCDGCGSVDYYSFGRYEDGRWIDKFDACVLDVIAWMPLPDPPAFD
jgi:hypothetical protein